LCFFRIVPNTLAQAVNIDRMTDFSRYFAKLTLINPIFGITYLIFVQLSVGIPYSLFPFFKFG
jgi:hypothetical protein